MHIRIRILAVPVIPINYRLGLFGERHDSVFVRVLVLFLFFFNWQCAWTPNTSRAGRWHPSLSLSCASELMMSTHYTSFSHKHKIPRQQHSNFYIHTYVHEYTGLIATHAANIFTRSTVRMNARARTRDML